MKLSPKAKTILIITYVLFMICGAFYISFISKFTSIYEVNENKTQAIKSKPARVTLIVNNLTTYTLTLDTEDSVAYLLDQLRKDTPFDFEKTRYTYGTEIDNINGQKAPDGYKWKILRNGLDITFTINNTKLIDQATYDLTLVKQ
jgi:hypothetical protein